MFYLNEKENHLGTINSVEEEGEGGCGEDEDKEDAITAADAAEAESGG